MLASLENLSEEQKKKVLEDAKKQLEKILAKLD